MGKLDGKVAVITGAASGTGRATAVRFAREGAAVVVADLNSPAGEETISEITAAGGSAVFQYTDVGSEADLKALFDRALKVIVVLVEENNQLVSRHGRQLTARGYRSPASARVRQ